MATRTVGSGIGGGIGGRWVAAWGRFVFVEFSGAIATIDPVSGVVVRIGTGYVQPEDVLLAPDGTTLLVSERGGTICQVDANAADRANAVELASGLVAPHQMALSSDGTAVYVVEFAVGTGRLLRVPLDGAPYAVVTATLDRAVGLALDATDQTAFVTEQGSGKVSAIDLATGTRTNVVGGLTAPFFLAWADASGKALLVAERDPVNRVSVVDPTATPPQRRVVSTVPFRPSSAAVAGTEVLVCCDTEIAAIDISAGLAPTVTLQMPAQPLYVGGYARVPVRVAGAGLSFEDLSFEVPDGPAAGSLSTSRDATFDPARPEVMLLGGSVPGTYALVARETATGNVLAKEKFELTAEWLDEANGPPIAFVGPAQGWVTGGAWGGGPAGPQNVNVIPASGTRRVCVVLVDTTSSPWPTTGTTVADAQALWSNELLGTNPDADGIRRSVHHYFTEVSDNRFDVSLVGSQVPGPFNLPNGWTSYFDWNTDRSVWWANGNYFQAVVTAAQDTVNFDDVDTLVVVTRSLAASVQMGTSLFSWPVAGGGNFTYHRPGQTNTVQRSFQALNMPHDWQTVDTRRIHETLSHEIGHNIGLPDLYMMNVTGFGSAMQARDIGPWDLMSQENPLPHLSIAHKMMLGWVDGAAIRSFDFAAGGGVDQMVTLQATGALGGGIPAGRVAGIEVRRANGWNYYFEYRSGQMPDIGDQQLNPTRALIGTDVVSGIFSPPVSRRSIVLLPTDVDGDGPILSLNSTDYEEDDPSGPAKFQLDLVSTAADNAQVRVRYGSGGRPDPSIRPWPGGDVWKSPDIEVRNAKSDADSGWLNVPWAGHTNRLVAKVKNGGNFVATNVTVNFFVKDFAITDAPEFFIGSDRKTIPPNATLEFQTEWTPPANTPTDDAHYCVVVRIPLYQDPGNPAIVELTELNNVAQSNYTKFISSTASPAVRGLSHVAVNNPYPERTRVWVVGQQSMPFYRTYLQHQWVWLAPGETRRIGVMYESLAGDPRFAGQVKEIFERYYRIPNRVSIIGLMENPMDEKLHVADVCGGANVVVASGRQTRIVDFKGTRDFARGRVITVDDRRPVTQGRVIVSVRADGKGRREVTRVATLRSDGEFVVELLLGREEERKDPKEKREPLLEAKVLRLQAHYLGAFALGDSDSEVLVV